MVSSAVRHRLDWIDGAVLWTIDESGADGEGFAPVALQARRSIAFEVPPPASAMASLTARAGTYRRRNHGALHCRLRRPGTEVLASGTVDLSTLEDNAFAPLLDLGGVAFEPGRPASSNSCSTPSPATRSHSNLGDADEPRPAARRRLRGFVPGMAIGVGEAVRGLLPNFRLDWTERDAAWATWASGASELTEAHDLTPGVPLEFDLVAPARRLDTVSVQFGTHAHRSRSHLAFELVASSIEVLHRDGSDLAEVVDNGFAPVAHLGEVDLEPGRKYRARLHWLGPEGVDVAVYAAPVRAGRYELRPPLERLEPDRVFAARSWAKAGRAADIALLVLDPAAADRLAPALAGARALFPEGRPAA